MVAYKIDDANVNSDQPTLLPGSTFEVNTVLADPKMAGMEISIQWPYGSNLHCEILVDDQIVAQADQFIAPRLFRVKDDPLYGVLQCGAPLDTPVAGQIPTTAAPAAPPAEAPPTCRPPDGQGLGPPSGGLWPMPRRARMRRRTTAPWPRRSRRADSARRLAAR